MNANQYRARLAEGIPPGNLTAAAMLTVRGVNGSGARYQNRSTWDQARAAYAVNLNLATNSGRPFPSKTNPYAQILRSKYATPGLGDDFDTTTAGAAFTPDYSAPIVESDAPINQAAQAQTYSISTTPIMSPQPTAGSSSDWAGVLNSASSKSIFSGIGTGLARLIGGGSTPSILPSSLTSSSMPSLGTMLMIGGAVLIGGMIFFRKKSSAVPA